MKAVDIMEAFMCAVEETIYDKWKHEGFIGGFTSDSANFEIDGKEYVLNLKEVHSGRHYGERRSKTMDNPCKHCDKSNLDFVNDNEYGCSKPCKAVKDFYKWLGEKLDEMLRRISALGDRMEE